MLWNVWDYYSCSQSHSWAMTAAACPCGTVFRHFRILYCFVLTLFFLQIAGFLYLYEYLSEARNCEHRVKRETLDSSDNSVNVFQDLTTAGKPEIGSRRSGERKNVTKERVIAQNEDGMIVIGHSTKIPVNLFFSSFHFKVFLKDSSR